MASTASTAASRALARGKSFLGYRETPARSNRTRFGKQYGWDGVAWCVIFVWCVLQDTGTTAGVVKTASTGAMERWARSVGRTVSTPRAGDLIILRNSKGATTHTEFVYSYTGGRLLGLGGNTSGGIGSIADGGTVAINDRTSLWKRGRIRFVRPFYGVTTDDVKTVQKTAGITVDGKLGAATVAAVKRLQGAAGLSADGFPGPATMAAITGSAPQPVAKPVVSEPAVPAVVDGQLVVDGRWGVALTKALQRFLNTRVKTRVLKVDGRTGPDTWRSLQEYLGHPVVDGIIEHQSYKPDELGNGISPNGWKYVGRGGKGSKTIKRLQRWVGVEQDGVVFEGTTRALQSKLNDHAA